MLNSRRFFKGSGGRQAESGLPFSVQRLDPEALARLDWLVEVSDARIVISSSWRHACDYHEIAEMFASRGLRHPDRVIGQTPIGEGFRGKEIEEWLATDEERARIDDSEAGVLQYVILDDSTDFTSEQTREHFIHTDARVGLTDDDARRALAILQRT